MNSSNQRIRLGILVDSPQQPSWVHSVIAEIQESNVVQIDSLLLFAAKKKRCSYLKKIRQLLWTTYSVGDRKVFRPRLDHFKKSDISVCFPHIVPRVLQMDEVKKKYLQQNDLDLVLCFGLETYEKEIGSLGPKGVWNLRLSDSRTPFGNPPGFWEVMSGSSLTGTSLTVLSPSGNEERILCQSFSPTYAFSVSRNQENFIPKCFHFVPQELKKMQVHGKVETETRRSFVRVEKRQAPGNFLMGLFLAKLSWRILLKFFEKILTFPQWTFAYKWGELSFPPSSFQDFSLCVPPKDCYWGDPFPHCKEGKTVLFLEEFLTRTNRGHISAVEFDEQGKMGKVIPIIERGYHLSYPFLFEEGGSLFMIPESSENRTVELYRCCSFPYEWRFEKVLLSNVDARDATLVHKNGKWWMFVNVATAGTSSSDELSIYYADQLFGEWIPHEGNPVKSDARNSRPAGRMFRHNGKLFRPAQDCSQAYGFAISLNEVKVLDSQKYIEEEVRKIYPDWNSRISRTHTVNQAGNLTVIDGFLNRRRIL